MLGEAVLPGRPAARLASRRSAAVKRARRALPRAARTPTPGRPGRGPCPSRRALRARTASPRSAARTGTRRMPSRPISPSPRFAWRSRLEPSGVIESFTCSEPSRSRPTTRSNSSSTAGEPSARADVVARGEQVAGVQADAEPLVAAGDLDQPRQLLERAPERAARAGGVLEVQRAVLGLRERLGDHRAGALDRRVDRAAVLQRRAGVQHDRVRAERRAGAQRATSATRATSRGSPRPRRRS